MESGAVLEFLDGLKDDGAEVGSAPDGGGPGAEAGFVGGEVREEAAGGRADVVDEAESAVEEGALAQGVGDGEGGVRGGFGVEAPHFGGAELEEAGDGEEIGRSEFDAGFAAAGGALGAIEVGLDAGADLVDEVEAIGVCVEVAAEGEVLGLFLTSEAREFGREDGHATTLAPNPH